MQIIILELSLFFKVLTAKLAAGHRLFLWVLKRFETSSSVSSAAFQMEGVAQGALWGKQTSNRKGLGD